MGIVDDVYKDFLNYRYSKKCKILNISSPFLFACRHSDIGDNVLKSISNSYDSDIFRSKMNDILEKDYDNDFLDLSLVMGKLFKKYNLYPYLAICPEIRMMVANKDDFNISRILIHCNKISDYFCSKYGIDESFFKDILLDKMLYLEDDEIVYKIEKCFLYDLCKVLIMCGIKGSFVDCEEAISTFDSYNENYFNGRNK